MVKPPFLTSHGPDKGTSADAVVVIGLGRFGTALALELMATGTDVLGIDANEEIVQSLNGRLTHVVRADSTKEEALRQLSVHEFDRAVVGIGHDLQASILTTSLLLGFDNLTVWAKATTAPHGEILKQLGVDHVVFPESDMGRRGAHLVRSDLLDFIEIDDGFAMVKAHPPAHVVGRPLGASRVLAEHGVTVVAVKPQGGRWSYATADTVLSHDDSIIVAGETTRAETFGRSR